MGTRYRDYNPEQPYLLPPSPGDWPAESHPACFISDMLDLRRQGDGRRKRLRDARGRARYRRRKAPASNPRRTARMNPLPHAA